VLNPGLNPVPEQEPEPECITVPIPLRQKVAVPAVPVHNTGEEPKKLLQGTARYIYLEGSDDVPAHLVTAGYDSSLCTPALV
jgi:hypothetical protein